MHFTVNKDFSSGKNVRLKIEVLRRPLARKWDQEKLAALDTSHACNHVMPAIQAKTTPVLTIFADWNTKKNWLDSFIRKIGSLKNKKAEIRGSVKGTSIHPLWKRALRHNPWPIKRLLFCCKNTGNHLGFISSIQSILEEVWLRRLSVEENETMWNPLDT